MKIINSKIPTLEEIMTAYGFQKDPDSNVWHLTLNMLRVGGIQEEQLLMVYPERIFQEIGSFVLHQANWKAPININFTNEDLERINYGLLCEWKSRQYYCDAYKRIFVQAEVDLSPRIMVVKSITAIEAPATPRIIAKAFIKWDYPGGTNENLPEMSEENWASYNQADPEA